MKSHLFRIAFCAILSSPVSAGTYTWTNLVTNGFTGATTAAYLLTDAANWDTAPTFDAAAHLQFTGLGETGSTTIWGGNATTILNRMTVDTSTNGFGLRINSSASTLSFEGLNPTIDVESGLLRLELKIAAAGGLTKTGEGTFFSNLQSISSGFTGPFTIAQGEVRSGNNWALGEAKTVNILSGGMANMNGQLWGSSSLVGGSTLARNYTFNIAGNGVNDQGAIINGNTNIAVLTGISGITFVNLTDNASVGGSANYAMGYDGTIDGNGFTLTKTGANEVYISGVSTNISYSVAQGTLVGYRSDLAFAGAAGSVSVSNAATLAGYGNRNFSNALTFAAGAILDNKSGTNTWSGNATLSGGSTTITGASSSAAINMAGVLSGDGGITKTSSNTLALLNTNTYTGKTLVNQGTVALGANGSISNSSEIEVSSGAFFDVVARGGFVVTTNQTLSGSGTVRGTTTIADGATISPGNSPGNLTVDGDLIWTGGGNYNWQVLGTTNTTGFAAGTTWDLITVTGTLDLTALSAESKFNINLWSLASTLPDVNGDIADFVSTSSYTWRVLGANLITGFNADYFNVNTSAINGTAGFANTTGPGSSFGVMSDGTNLYVTYTAGAGPSPIPEPGTWAAAGLLLAGGAFMRWRQRRKVA